MAKDNAILSVLQSLREYDQDNYISAYHLEDYSDDWYSENLKLDEISKRHKEEIVRKYRSLGFIEDVSLLKLKMTPSYAVNSAQDTCILAGCYSYGITYNTLRTDEINRAKQTCVNAILPVLQRITPSLKQIGYPYVLVGASYGYRDFSDSLSSEGACVFCLFKLADALDFSNLDLTQQELLEKASIYVREGQNEMKRISF